MALSSPYRAPRSAADRMDPQHNSASSHRVSRPILMSSWGALHRVFYNVLFLIVGLRPCTSSSSAGRAGRCCPRLPPRACDRRTLRFHEGQRSERILS